METNNTKLQILQSRIGKTTYHMNKYSDLAFLLYYTDKDNYDVNEVLESLGVSECECDELYDEISYILYCYGSNTEVTEEEEYTDYQKQRIIADIDICICDILKAVNKYRKEA